MRRLVILVPGFLALVAITGMARAVEGGDGVSLPLSDQKARLEEMYRILDAHCQLAGQAAEMAVKTVGTAAGFPSAPTSTYASGIGVSIQQLPGRIATEWRYQRAQASTYLPRFYLPANAFDQVVEKMDRLGGGILDEITRSDVLLRGFESYRLGIPLAIPEPDAQSDRR